MPEPVASVAASAPAAAAAEEDNATARASPYLDALDHRKDEKLTPSEALQPLREEPKKAAARGSEEWQHMRSFKSRLGEVLRKKWFKQPESVMKKDLKAWDEKGDGKVGKKQFERKMKDLGFEYTQSADKGPIDSMFDSMRRHGRDGHISLDDLTKVLQRLKLAAEAAVSEVADIAKTEQVMDKKLEELDVLEERIEKYYATIDTEEQALADLIERTALGVRVGNLLLEKFDPNNKDERRTIQEWLATWDKDGDGRINQAEFALELVKNKIVTLQADGKPTKEHMKEIYALFVELDLDGDGRMSPKELKQALKKLQALALSYNADKKGHEVMIELAKQSVKSAEEAVLLVLNCDEDDEALVQATKEKQTFEFRLGDLFRRRSVTAVLKEWDNDGNGHVTMPELQDALQLIGDEEAVADFFKTVDVDQSGSIEIDEIKRVCNELVEESEAREAAVIDAAKKVEESRELAAAAVKEAVKEPNHRRSVVQREANKAAGLDEEGNLPVDLLPKGTPRAQGTPRKGGKPASSGGSGGKGPKKS